MHESLSITTADGCAMPAEILRPQAAATKAPGIVLIPAIFGLDEGTRDIMAFYAEKGYPVLVPDLFWRSIPGPLGREGEDRDKAQARYAGFDVDQGVADLGDAVAWLRKDAACNGKVVVFGYCFGGRYAYLAGTRLGVEGGVSFHGTKIGLNLDEADRLACPLSIHVGDSDPSIPMAEVEATRAALEGKPGVRVHVYPGCVHGFTGKGRPSYDAAADAASTQAALALLSSL